MGVASGNDACKVPGIEERAMSMLQDSECVWQYEAKYNSTIKTPNSSVDVYECSVFIMCHLV